MNHMLGKYLGNLLRLESPVSQQCHKVVVQFGPERLYRRVDLSSVWNIKRMFNGLGPKFTNDVFDISISLEDSGKC